MLIVQSSCKEVDRIEGAPLFYSERWNEDVAAMTLSQKGSEIVNDDFAIVR